jgi:hypothetical protein
LTKIQIIDIIDYLETIMYRFLLVLVFSCAFVYIYISFTENVKSQTFPIEPNSVLTPGAVNPQATKDIICVKGYTGGEDAEGNNVRHVTEATKKKVFQEYRLTGKEQHFEIDHLISLELGGSNDITNLWPESYETKPVNAHTKDALENRLHALVCKGQLDLATAQHDIATDWEAAYQKYVGPLPK